MDTYLHLVHVQCHRGDHRVPRPKDHHGVLLGDARRPHGLPLALRDPRPPRHRARGPQRDVRPVFALPTSRRRKFTRRYLDEVLGWTLAAVGFYFQYTQMFSPPFIVELLLWPLQTIEYGLLYAVASTSAPAAA